MTELQPYDISPIQDCGEPFSLPPLSIPKPYNGFGPLTCYDVTKVDLTDFLPPVAKIDRLDVIAHPEDLAGVGRRALTDNLQGSIAFSNNMRGERCRWFMVNDPTRADLAYLVDNFYDRQLIRIEVAIDFRLPAGTNDLRPLWVLKAQLRHCLSPKKFNRLKSPRRRRAQCLGERNGKPVFRYVADGLGMPPPDTQVIWEDTQGADVLALYVKTHDQGKEISGQPFLRLELRLRDSGPQAAGCGRLGLLPAFAKGLRAKLMPAFHVGAGFVDSDALKGRGVPRNVWDVWGAQWAAKRAIKVRPDATVNRAIGFALAELRDRLMKIAPPSKVASNYSDWVDDYTY